MITIPSIKVKKEDFDIALNVFKNKGIITVPHLIKELKIDSAKATRLYNLLKDYCLAEGICIKYKQTLYLISSNSPEVKELRNVLLKKSGRLDYVVYSVIKTHGKDCVKLDEIINIIINMFKTPTPYILEAVYKLWSKGLIIEKRRACFRAIDEL